MWSNLASTKAWRPTWLKSMNRRPSGGFADLRNGFLMLKNTKNTNRSGGVGLYREGGNPFFEVICPENVLTETPSYCGKGSGTTLLGTLREDKKGGSFS